MTDIVPVPVSRDLERQRDWQGLADCQLMVASLRCVEPEPASRTFTPWNTHDVHEPYDRTDRLLLFPVPLPAQPVSYVDLARHVQYQSIKILPDGEYFAATALVKNQTVLALIHRADMKIKVIRPRETDDVINSCWGSAKRVVYTLGVHQGSYAPRLAAGELFGVNADGSYPDLYYGQRNGSMGTVAFIAPIDNDPDNALVAVSK